MKAPEEWGEVFKTFLALQTSWWVVTYAVIYRFQPTLRVLRTSWGSAAVHAAGAWLQRVWPSRYESIAQMGRRVLHSPNGRTTGEFVLINKAFSPAVFPLLVATANGIVKRRADQSLGADAKPDHGLASKEEPLQQIVRTLSAKVERRTSATRRQPVDAVRPNSNEGS